MFTEIYKFLNTMYESIQESRILYRSYCELNSLTDRELSDLGINRYDIPRIIFETTYKK